MKVIEVQGKTVSDATKKAMALLGVSDASQINVEVVDEGKSGIFGFGVSQPAMVRVYYNNEGTDIGGAAKEVLLTITEKMGFDCSVSDIKESEEKVYLELESKNSVAEIIGRQGRTLEALQFLVNLIVNHQTDDAEDEDANNRKNGSKEKRIILDIEQYREKRERALRKISKDAAEKVARSGKPQTLEPMNPFERRLVHLALQNDERVTTVSKGEGVYRKITIMPTSS